MLIEKRKSKFNYLRDPLFLVTVALYILNRHVVKPLTVGKTDFFNCYFNDLICIPFCLPIVLFVTRAVRLRDHDQPPDLYELCFYLLLWSFFFEYVAPKYSRYLNNPVGDPWDVVFYVLGGLVAGLYWNFEIGKRSAPKDTPEEELI